jgi:proteic killer suppression protein
MLGTIKHRGLRLLSEEDDPRLLNPEHVEKLKYILFALGDANSLYDLKQDTLRLQKLTGNYKGFYAMTVRANWRVITDYISQCGDYILESYLIKAAICSYQEEQ